MVKIRIKSNQKFIPTFLISITHPLSTYGHSSGVTLGMWDSQGGMPVTGDYRLYENIVYSFELSTIVTIPDWKKDIRIMLEEAGY
jgi:hypothetical protein